MNLHDPILGTSVVTRVTTRLTRQNLRIVAYHGVPDSSTFRSQIAYLAKRFRILKGTEVATAIAAGDWFLPNSAWITFDDGKRDIIQRGLPVLRDFGLNATMFVCPGLMESAAPFWWSQVEAGLSQGPLHFENKDWTDQSLIFRLKAVPDSERRDFLETIGPLEIPDEDRSVGVDEVREWLGSGMEIGNHSWDHPCMDKCTQNEQRRQVIDAHDYLADLLGTHPRVFAYPNGDFTDSTIDAVQTAGYDIALAFDHRLATKGQDPYKLSRLKLDANAPLPRSRAVISGSHSSFFQARARLRGILAS